MRISRRFRRPWILLGAVSLALAALAQSKGVVLPQDKGPNKVDVSVYPAEVQENYKAFKRFCSKCHTLARPLNTTMSPSYWARYVGIMLDKSPEKISDEEAKRIYDFIVYDQKARKDKDQQSYYPPLTEDEIAKLKKEQGVGG